MNHLNALFELLKRRQEAKEDSRYDIIEKIEYLEDESCVSVKTKDDETTGCYFLSLIRLVEDSEEPKFKYNLRAIFPTDFLGVPDVVSNFIKEDTGDMEGVIEGVLLSFQAYACIENIFPLFNFSRTSNEVRQINSPVYERLNKVASFMAELDKKFIDRVFVLFDDKEVRAVAKFINGTNFKTVADRDDEDQILLTILDSIFEEAGITYPELFEARARELFKGVTETTFEQNGVTFSSGVYTETTPETNRFVFYVDKGDGYRVEEGFGFQGGSATAQGVSLFSDLVSDLLTSERIQLHRSLRMMETSMVFASRFLAAFDEKERETLKLQAPKIEWEEPILRNLPWVSIPMAFGISLGFTARPHDVCWVGLLFDGEQTSSTLQTWYYDFVSLSDEDIRKQFMENIGIFHLSHLVDLSHKTGLPFIVNNRRVSVLSNQNTTFPNIQDIRFEHIGICRAIAVVATDKHTRQRLRVNLGISPRFIDRLEELFKYFQEQFENFKYFS